MKSSGALSLLLGLKPCKDQNLLSHPLFFRGRGRDGLDLPFILPQIVVLRKIYVVHMYAHKNDLIFGKRVKTLN